MMRSGGAPLGTILVLGTTASLLLPAAAAGAILQPGTADEAGFAPAEVVVRYEPGTSGGERAAVRAEADAELERSMAVPRMELLSLDRGESVPGAVAALEREPGVAFAEPNFVYELALVPDDPAFDFQWPLLNEGLLGGTEDADIDAPEAWGRGYTGDPGVVVAVVDGGVTMDHPDLDDNIWANPGETGGGLETNGLDDDGNGLVDDHRGWDWVGDNSAPPGEDNDPSDEEGHGTHVAGTVGAEGDNAMGVAGVAWDTSMMVLRACDIVGSCLNADVADAFAYAGENGAEVVNASLSGSGSSQAQQAAIAVAPDTLFVVAAGNEGGDNDAFPRYPCNYSGANLICVGATNDDDALAGFSNFGASSVDLAAPGGGVPGAGVYSTGLTDRVNETFTSATLGGGWSTGGTNNTWARTAEVSGLPGPTLTDSPGANYLPDTASFARFGPVDLSDDTSCHLRYEVAIDLPDLNDDRLEVQASTNGTSFTTLQTLTGSGEALLTPDLSAFAGSDAYIRFRLVTDSSPPVGDGAHIDNVKIRCTTPDYTLLQGTSMAAPHVAGAAALMLEAAPAASIADLREWLLDGVDLESSLDGKVASGGRLNLDRSLGGALGEDIDRPETAIVSGPPATSTLTSASFSFNSDEPGSFSCSLNGAAFSACPSSHALFGLAIGTHNFKVRAVDTAGNEDATPAAYSFTVEPLVIVTNPCTKLRRKLKKAKSAKLRSKLRRKLKKNKCVTKAKAKR